MLYLNIIVELKIALPTCWSPLSKTIMRQIVDFWPKFRIFTWINGNIDMFLRNSKIFEPMEDQFGLLISRNLKLRKSHILVRIVPTLIYILYKNWPNIIYNAHTYFIWIWTLEYFSAPKEMLGVGIWKSGNSGNM